MILLFTAGRVGDHDPLGNTDLRGSQTDAWRFVHSFNHVLDKLDFGIHDFAHGLRRLLQHFGSPKNDRSNHKAIQSGSKCRL